LKVINQLVRGGHKIDITWVDGKLKSAVLHTGHDDHSIVKYGNLTKPLELKVGKTVLSFLNVKR
jgi:hypothetical protein